MIVLSQAKHLYVVLQDNLTVKQPISKLKAKQCYSTNSWWFIAAEYANSPYVLPYLHSWFYLWSEFCIKLSWCSVWNSSRIGMWLFLNDFKASVWLLYTLLTLCYGEACLLLYKSAQTSLCPFWFLSSSIQLIRNSANVFRGCGETVEAETKSLLF